MERRAYSIACRCRLRAWRERQVGSHRAARFNRTAGYPWVRSHPAAEHRGPRSGRCGVGRNFRLRFIGRHLEWPGEAKGLRKAAGVEEKIDPEDIRTRAPGSGFEEGLRHPRPVDTDSTPPSYTAADSKYGDLEKLHPWNPSNREEKRDVHFAPINRAPMYLKIGRRGHLGAFKMPIGYPPYRKPKQTEAKDPRSPAAMDYESTFESAL